MTTSEKLQDLALLESESLAAGAKLGRKLTKLQFAVQPAIPKSKEFSSDESF